jgi:peptide/nickel transport system permease protein
MLWVVLRKLAVLIATVLVTAVLTYALLAVAPGAVAEPNGMLGWLGHALVGNFGQAADGSSVGGLIAARLAVTVPLALLALILTTIIGGGIGYFAARRPGSVGDRVLQGLAAFGIAAPNFWLGMVLSLLFATMLHWLPPGGFVPWQDNAGAALLSLLLPALALALPVAGPLAIRTRDVLVDTRASGSLRGAQIRGLTAQEAMRREGLPYAALRIAASLGGAAATIIASSVIVETVFYLPGLGRLILDALGTHDLALVRGGLVVLVLLICGAVFLSALGTALADPRSRPERAE